jgi:hypothetical protein
MPYVKTTENHCNDESCTVTAHHRHVQVLLNPISVIGRMNVGQLYETTLAKISEKTKKPFIVKPFENTWDLKNIQEALVSNGFSDDGKEQLYFFENDTENMLRYKSLVGPQYFLRLHHMPEDKLQGRAKGRPYDYTLRDEQPRKGKKIRNGQILGSGQRFGEMETWAMAGHAAWSILDDILTVKSDDRRLRRKNITELVDFDTYRRPQALVNLILIFRSLGLDLRLLDKHGNNVTQNFLNNSIGEQFEEITLSYAGPDQIAEWEIGGQITSLNLYSPSNNGSKIKGVTPDPEGLLSREIFDPQKPWQMGVIRLTCPVIHPMTKYLGKTHNAEGYMLDTITVLPISFRNERLGFALDFQDDLNIHYRNIMQRNSQLKSVLADENTDKELKERLNANLTKAVESLFLGGQIFGKSRRGIKDILWGKQGLVRGHMAGKRTDYSGRAVIIGDPTLSLDEAGIPESLWGKILPDVPKKNNPLILLNRQPSLHRYSILAFKASCHNRGDVIRINPFVCKPFNADFDGDAMAVHVPRTAQAKSEVEKLLPSRNLISQANGKTVLGFDKDIALAAAYMTYSPSIETDDEIPLISEHQVPIADKDCWNELGVQGIKTTAGRLHIKRMFGDVPVLNRCLDKGLWHECMEKLAKKASIEDSQVFVNSTNEISSLFQDTLKKSGLSLSLSDFSRPNCIDAPGEQPPPLLWLLWKSGKYNKDLEKHIILKRDQMRRPGTDDEPTESIESSLMKGHTETEYMCSAHGGRAGLVDKGLITAKSGHFLRDLIYRLQHLYIVEEDCGTSEGISASDWSQDQIVGIRYDVNGRLITEISSTTQFRSPLTCKAQDHGNHRGICQKCYGLDPATAMPPMMGLPVGILAAQAIGERVSQETLKSFHTGGTKGKGKKGLSLVSYLRKTFSKNSKNPKFQKAVKIYEQFPELTRPNLVHFEIVLAGYKIGKNPNGLLSKLAHSQAPRYFFEAAVMDSRDDLYDVISRIVSGRLLTTSDHGGSHA